MCRWSSTTTWPRRSKITRIVSAVLVELANTEQPSRSAPRTILRCSTTWKLFFSPVLCRLAHRNWQTIQMLSINLELSSSVRGATKRFSLDFSSTEYYNPHPSFYNPLERKNKIIQTRGLSRVDLTFIFIFLPSLISNFSYISSTSSILFTFYRLAVWQSQSDCCLTQSPVGVEPISLFAYASLEKVIRVR